MKKPNYLDDDKYFKKFAVSLQRAIASYGALDEETLVERQKRQVERLVELETEFRYALIKHSWGPSVYRKFVHFICEERKNILAARPYFRERQPIFTKEIAKALKLRADASLYKFHFNYQFILFAMRQKPWPKGGKLTKLLNEISALRTELVELNLPLAIARAKLFWRSTPRSHLTYMDLVQIACEGLMSAVDKFVLPYSKAFRHVVIGRIVGNSIENYSETLIHFYPSDKRKLYRANKLIKNHDNASMDYDKLANEINTWDGAEGVKTNGAEIADLMAAASCFSTSFTGTNADGEEDEEVPDLFKADNSFQPDVQVEESEASEVTSKAIAKLFLFERKLLLLKGISL